MGNWRFRIQSWRIQAKAGKVLMQKVWKSHNTWKSPDKIIKFNWLAKFSEPSRAFQLYIAPSEKGGDDITGTQPIQNSWWMIKHELMLAPGVGLYLPKWLLLRWMIIMTRVSCFFFKRLLSHDVQHAWCMSCYWHGIEPISWTTSFPCATGCRVYESCQLILVAFTETNTNVIQSGSSGKPHENWMVIYISLDGHFGGGLLLLNHFLGVELILGTEQHESSTHSMDSWCFLEMAIHVHRVLDLPSRKWMADK